MKMVHDMTCRLTFFEFHEIQKEIFSNMPRLHFSIPRMQLSFKNDKQSVLLFLLNSFLAIESKIKYKY